MKPALFAALGATLLMTQACTPHKPGARAPAAPPASPPAAAYQEPDPDQCGAAALRSFIGGPLASLPPVPAGATRRVVGDDEPMTMDFRSDRQTVVYVRATTNILSINCV